LAHIIGPQANTDHNPERQETTNKVPACHVLMTNYPLHYIKNQPSYLPA